MKKTNIFFAVLVVLILLAATGCTGQEKALADIQTEAEKSTVDVIGIPQIEDELGFPITLPATIEEETCSIIDGRIGAMEFTLKGLSYSYYIQTSDQAQDLTGTADTMSQQETVLAGDTTYQLSMENGSVGLAYWYDETNKTACTLLLHEKATPELLKEVTESIIAVQ